MTYMYIYVVFLLQDAQRKHITEQYKNHYNVERIGLDLLYVKEIFEICISVDWPISLHLVNYILVLTHSSGCRSDNWPNITWSQKSNFSISQ